MDFKHGTPAGYRKCRKRPSGACAECLAAEAAYKADYRARVEAANAETLAEAMEALPDVEGFDELAEVRRTLEMTDALLYRAKSPRDSAPLVQRRLDLVTRIAELERAAAVERGEGKRVTPLDEIGRRRAERLNRAAG